MKQEDFLRCLSEIDDELIREAADVYEISDKETGENRTASEKTRKISRKKVTSVSSGFMKAAAVALLIGVAVTVGVSLNNRNTSQKTDGSSGEISAVSEEDPDVSVTAKPEDKKEKTPESVPSESVPEVSAEPDQTDPGTNAPAGSEGFADPNKEETPVVSAKKDTGSTSSGKSGSSVFSSGTNASEKDSTNPAVSASQKKSEANSQSAAGNSSSGEDAQDSGQNTESQDKTNETSENASSQNYTKASFNGNDYYANSAEARSWQISGYLGEVEVTSEDTEETMTASAYSIEGVGEDRTIALRIGDSDKLYTYVSETAIAESSAAVSESQSESVPADEDLSDSDDSEDEAVKTAETETEDSTAETEESMPEDAAEENP